MDNCEENVEEIYFTDFMMKICNHVQMGDYQLLGAPAEAASSTTAAASKLLKVERIVRGKPCSEYENNHAVIKKKFTDILSNSFQLVPHSNDLYYFCPTSCQIGDDYYPVPSRIRRDTKETGTGSSNVDEEDLVGKMKIIMNEDNPEEDEILSTRTKKTNTNKIDMASSLSLLSNTSEQSDLINESNSRDDAVNFDPLFLQVYITIKHDKDEMINCPISLLPTCLVDLITNTNANHEDGKELDLSRLTIYLDLLTITLTKEMPIEFGNRYLDKNRKRSVSLSSTMSISEFQKSSSEVSLASDTGILDLAAEETLPSQQLEAFNNVIKEIKWMVRDEMAFALTQHSINITEATLNTVVDHIKDSDGKPGCTVDKIPLDYVFGHEVSHALFMKMFKDFDIPGWRAIRVQDNFMYFLHNDPQDITDDNDDVLIVDEPMQRFQLSPVKEALASTTSDDAETMSITDSGANDQEVLVWRDDPQKNKKKPQFWLILRITESEVEIYFQYREGQFEALLPWRQTQKLIVSEVRSISKKVNQSFLLKDLFDNKVCNRLLEAETSEEIWSYSRHR